MMISFENGGFILREKNRVAGVLSADFAVFTWDRVATADFSRPE
jgi:hypothetical protein